MPNEFEQWSPEFVNVGFIARYCGVSNATVLRWIERGQLPAFRLPAGHYRIERQSFLEFLTKYNMPVFNRAPKNKYSLRHTQQGKNARK